MEKIIEGLSNNILLTALAFIMPWVLGCLMSILFSTTKKLDFIRKIFQIISLGFESLCPLITILVLFYVVGSSVRFSNAGFVFAALGLAISFIGYMPRRYDPQNSIMKNLLVNSIGLMSNIFKWSFCASIIGVMEMARAASNIAAHTCEYGTYFIVFAISFVVILTLELTRYLLKEYLK